MVSLIRLLSAFTLACLLAGPAWSLDLDNAKAQGLVGEQSNGYLGVVVDRADVINLVNSINEKRRSAYLESAANAGVELSIMEQRIGQRLIQRTPSGQYIRQPDGHWVKK